MIEFCQNMRAHTQHEWWCIKDVMMKTCLGISGGHPIRPAKNGVAPAVDRGRLV